MHLYAKPVQHLQSENVKETGKELSPMLSREGCYKAI